MERASKQVIVTVSAELLHQLLQFPRGARVTGMRHDIGFGNEVYELRVESDQFPETAPCCALPKCQPMYESRDGNTVFVGWRIDKGYPVIGSPEYHAAVEALKVAKVIRDKLDVTPNIIHMPDTAKD